MPLRQLVIGIESTLIVTPVSILITALFRFRKAETNRGSEDGDSDNNFPDLSILTSPCFRVSSWFLCIATAATSASFTVFHSLQ